MRRTFRRLVSTGMRRPQVAPQIGLERVIQVAAPDESVLPIAIGISRRARCAQPCPAYPTRPAPEHGLG